MTKLAKFYSVHTYDKTNYGFISEIFPMETPHLSVCTGESYYIVPVTGMTYIVKQKLFDLNYYLYICCACMYM